MGGPQHADHLMQVPPDCVYEEMRSPGPPMRATTDLRTTRGGRGHSGAPLEPLWLASISGRRVFRSSFVLEEHPFWMEGLKTKVATFATQRPTRSLARSLHRGQRL